MSGCCFACVGRLDVKYSDFDKRRFSIFVASTFTSQFNFGNEYLLENILDSSHLERTIKRHAGSQSPMIAFFLCVLTNIQLQPRQKIGPITY